ncbi:TAXI family TRAP transporter solute-binding subunit [Isoptericola croceus]|uniref:TAXI family TRAP transporter solute-binding subunit n=1 Tax=Isoptericola croceus TaxID=3031406 RepID=UPI0023F7B422|nr:TAXI family TRAP transporter solute-binding subunit [Isoptericola croceus]
MRRLVAAVLSVLLPAALLAGCLGGESDPWDGQRPETLTIATGGTSGIYHGYGRALADVLSSRYGIEVEVLTTGGSVDNLHLLADGTADVAFSAADAVADAVDGVGDFAEPVEVQALARVYDDFAHLVVPADSEVEEIADLRGLRVSVGAARSGTSLIAGRVLAAAELPMDELRVAELGITESIDALAGGSLDALFWSGGLRTPGLVGLSEEMPVRLIPLVEVVDELRQEYGHGYRHGVVPEGVYGLADNVATLAVPNILVAGPDLPEGVAHGLLHTLFDARGEITSTVPSAALLDRSRAIYTEPADLQVGALRYYREVKP